MAITDKMMGLSISRILTGRRLPILGASVVTASLAAVLCCAATPAWANATGNFHLKGGGAVGCHWASFGGVAPPWGHSGFSRCERYSDHTFVEMTRKGRIIIKHDYKGWVAPGSNGRFPLGISHRLVCATSWVQPPGGGRDYELGCSFFPATGGPALKSFTIGEIGPVTIKRS